MKIKGGKSKGGIIVPTPDPTFSLFDFDNNPNGVENLDPAWTVNGQTVYPALRYNAADATPTGWKSWGYGGPLAEAGTGVSPSYNTGSPFLGQKNDGVKYNGTGTKYHLGQDVVPTIGTNDIIIEYVFRATNGSAGATVPGLFDLRLNTLTPGFTAYKSVGHHISVLYGTTANGLLHYFTSPAVSPVDGRYAYVVSCMDNSEGGSVTNGIRVWLNGVFSTATYALLGAGTVGLSFSAGEKLKIGYVVNAGSVTSEESIMYFAMWNKADLFAATGGSWTEMDTFVAKRAQKLFGTYPNQSRGTPSLISQSTRNSLAHFGKIESDGTTKLYSVSNNWARVESKKNGSSSSVVKGLLIEPAVTQRIAQSEEFSNASWAKTRSSIASTSIVCPTGFASTYVTLHEDATAGSTHFVSQSAVQLITGTRQTISVFAKPINRNWIQIENLINPNASAYFNVSTKTVGTTSGCVAGIDPTVYTNGWVRAYISFVATALTGSAISFYVASADNVNSFDGLNQDSLAIWGAQSEGGTAQIFPSSYLSSSAAVSRTADTFRYIGNDGNLSSSIGTDVSSSGTIEANIFLPSFDLLNNAYICDLTGSGTNRVSLYLNPTGDILQASSSLNSISQYDVSGSTDIVDGNMHSVKHVYQVNNASIFVDGALEGSPDTSCSSSVKLDRIDIGQSSAQTSQLNGLISNFKIYDRIK